MIKILDFDKVPASEIFARFEPTTSVESIVSDVIKNVRQNGDDALIEYSKKFDKVTLSSIEVSKREIQEALSLVEPKFLEILNEAKENITLYHKKQLVSGYEIKKEDGIVLGQKVIPLEKVGLYVPGGTATYPSTVLMDSIPAKVAGVKEMVMVTPPNSQGKIKPEIVAAAVVAGVDRIFKVGGAQAIAALAYGTQSIPRVDKIVGPGNAFVAEAKKQVFGLVDIDMIAGPSEILIVSDSKSNPSFVAADLLSQAEHDKMASAVLVCDSLEFASEVSKCLEEQIPLLSRSEIARASIDNNGKIIVTKDLQDAIRVSNEIAPEHLELCVEEPFKYLEMVKNAGSVFLGRYCPEALGDYFAGPNHTLPTSGTARFSSPLSVDDFIKKFQYTYYTKQALEKVADKVDYFANKEGLQAHGLSVTKRVK